MIRRHWRTGAALIAVLMALGLTSALMVGGAYVARELARAGGVAERGAELEACPEEAILRALDTWDPAARSAQAIGSTQPLGGPVGGKVQVSTRATRLNSRIFWITAIATDAAKPLLRRRLGLIVLADSGGVGQLPKQAWLELP